MLGEAAVQTKPSLLPQRTARVAAYAAAIFLGSFVALWRLPEQARGTLWAEDGILFLRDALIPGPTNPFTPYAGYLHVVPRLMTDLVTKVLPVEWYGVGMNYLSCLIVAGIAALVFHCSSAVTQNVFVRFGFASITILIAPAPIETLGNLSNLHWYFLWLTPWLLLKSARGTWEKALLFSAGLLGALTEPVTLMFLPLFLHRFRDRAYWPARAGLAIGMVCQVVSTLSAPRPGNGEGLDLLSVWTGWFLHSSAAIVFGSSYNIKHSAMSDGVVPFAAAALPFLGAFVFLLIKGAPKQRLLALVLVAASTGVYVAAQVANFNPTYDYADFTTAQWQAFYLTRYATPASMFLLALAPLLADVIKGRGWRLLIVAAFAAAQIAYFAPAIAGRQLGPSWSDGVNKARAACKAHTSPAPSVPIAPGKMKVAVPCEKLQP